MGNNIQIFGRTFSDVSSITVNNTSSSAVKYVQEPILEDITISQNYLVEQNTIISNGIIFQTDETYPGTSVVIDNARYANIPNGDLGQNGTGIKIDLNKTYHCTGELKIKWSTGEQEIYSIDSDFTPINYGLSVELSFSWEGMGTSTQTFNDVSLNFQSSSANGYKIFMRPGTANVITKSGVLLNGSYYQISVTNDGFNTINLNLSDDPRFQVIYKSLAYRSVIASSSPGVSEWCNNLSSIASFQFAGQSLSGDFIFSNVSFVGQYAFAWNYTGGFTGGATAYNLTFPILSRFYDNAIFAMNRGLTSIYCPSMTTIGSYAFYSCSSLTTISFPECTSIGSSAFQGCANLTTISFPECTYIGQNAFSGCTDLSTVNFSKCTTIGSYAFRLCYNLTNISFPKCTTINNYAFANCTGLSNIFFPSCTYISSYAFNGCNALVSISLPECSVIMYYAFSANLKLASISLPKCTSISNYAFSGCSSLSAVYLMGNSIISLGTNVFNNTPIVNAAYLGYFGSIYVPASLLASYQTATNWSQYSARMVGI